MLRSFRGWARGDVRIQLLKLSVAKDHFLKTSDLLQTITFVKDNKDVVKMSNFYISF